MPGQPALVKLERILRWTALVLGVLTTIGVTAGFGAASYRQQLEMRRFQAHIAAQRVAQYAYVHGEVWRFSQHRIGDLIAFAVPPGDTARAVVLDRRRREVVALGEPVPGPALSAEIPVVVTGERIGSVVIDASLAPVLLRAAVFAALGAGIGIAIYGCVQLLPVRALRRTIHELNAAQSDLRAQVALTASALTLAEAEKARAESASRMKSGFLANMSHELRTPLNAIIGFSEVMVGKVFGELPERYHEYAKDINHSGTHLLKIINEILDLAKIEAGRVEVLTAPVDVDGTVRACLNFVEGAAAEAGHVVRYDSSSATTEMVLAEETRLRQILLNLLSNAIKFTPAAAEIVVAVRRADASTVEIEVADSGIGMTAQEMELAFQPFRQVDNSHTRKYQGTGLGLPLAKRLSELMNGSLTLHSAPGAGTRAVVRLPTAARAVLASAA